MLHDRGSHCETSSTQLTEFLLEQKKLDKMFLEEVGGCMKQLEEMKRAEKELKEIPSFEDESFVNPESASEPLDYRSGAGQPTVARCLQILQQHALVCCTHGQGATSSASAQYTYLALVFA